MTCRTSTKQLFQLLLSLFLKGGINNSNHNQDTHLYLDIIVYQMFSRMLVCMFFMRIL